MSARQLRPARHVSYREASQEDEETEVAEEQADEGEEAKSSSASEGEAVDEADSSSEDREAVRCAELKGTGNGWGRRWGEGVAQLSNIHATVWPDSHATLATVRLVSSIPDL
jgi:cytochrome c5